MILFSFLIVERPSDTPGILRIDTRGTTSLHQPTKRETDHLNRILTAIKEVHEREAPKDEKFDSMVLSLRLQPEEIDGN